MPFSVATHSPVATSHTFTCCPRPRHDAPPVRKHGNATDPRRSQISTKAQWTPQRTRPMPFQRPTHSPLDVPHLERLVARRRHDALPVRKHGNALTYDEDRSSQNYSGRRTHESECPSSVATHSPVATSHTLSVRRPTQTRRAACPERWQRLTYDGQIITKVQRTPQRTLSECPSVATHSPVATSQTLSSVARRRHDAPPVRKHGNAITYDEARSSKSTVDAATHFPECPSSVATHSPVATSQTLSVCRRRGHDAPPVRKHGNAADLHEGTSSQKYSGRRNARRPSALPAPAARQASMVEPKTA